MMDDKDLQDELALAMAQSRIERAAAELPVYIDASAIGPNASNNVRNMILMLIDFVTEAENWDRFARFTKETAVLQPSGAEDPHSRMALLDWISALDVETMIEIAKRLIVPGEKPGEGPLS
jgi:hypothetical protein